MMSVGKVYLLKMNSFETLRQEIKSWYPNYEFSDVELDSATRDLIKFFSIGAMAIHEAKNENKGLQDTKNTVESNSKKD